MPLENETLPTTPRPRAPMPPHDREPGARDARTSTRPHVLVLDDEADLCELISLRLEHHGFRVSTEHTARGALEVLSRELVDVMVLDLRLDQESGMDVLAAVQERALDLPVVVLTAHGTVETAVEALERGAYGFLTKPFDDHELVQKLQHAVERVRLRRQLATLRRMLGEPDRSERLIGTSAAIAAVRERIARVAPSDVAVLLTGESGTGKEVAARSLHALSPRRERPFVAINCGALPTELLESELFGYKRGAFTGAQRDKDGLFAAAEGGTLFLDEIGDAPPAVQVKLLRVLQERAFHPVGATEPRTTDVRIVAATNKDLRAEVDAGRFREDLFYRLHVVPIALPPLRERREDIPLLAELFLSRAKAERGIDEAHLSPEALHILMAHDWPGNVRELANVVEGAALLSADGALRPAHVTAVLSQPARRPEPASPAPPPDARTLGALIESLLRNEMLPPLRQARECFDRAYLRELLRRCHGNVSLAARQAGRNRTDLHELLRRHEISAAEYRGQLAH